MQQRSVTKREKYYADSSNTFALQDNSFLQNKKTTNSKDMLPELKPLDSIKNFNKRPKRGSVLPSIRNK